jgi:signal transduction histidine kinase
VNAGGGVDLDAKAVLDRLPVGILVSDPERVVRYVNLAGRRVLHPTRARVGSPVPGVGEPSLAELVGRVVEHGLAGPADVRLGEDRVVVVEGLRNAHTGLVTLVLHDVSRRARVARAEHDFVVNAAHELLSPLTVIAAASDVLRDGGKEVPEVRDRFIGHIGDAAARLIRVSRALLTLARAEAGVEPPRLELVRLRPLLEEIVRGADAEGTLHCPETVAVLVERDLLEQALSNLVANAKRHSVGGEVDIVVDEVGERFVGIEIVDRGSGIPEEQLGRVGERFFSAMGRDSTGYGIGLSIAARSLDAFGGRLRLTSEPGRGTRAQVEVPSAEVIAP